MRFWVLALFATVGACVTPDEPDIDVATQEIVVDTPCNDTRLRLYDQPGFQGHRICFRNVGIADLRAYCRIPGPQSCLANWSGGVRSFMSGGNYVRFGDTPSVQNLYCSDGGPDAVFGPYNYKSSVSNCVINTRYVTILSVTP